MRTLKVLGIIGIITSAFCFWILIANDNVWNYEGGIAWGVIACFYLLALAIVAVVQSRKK